MLVLTRKIGQKIIIGDGIEVTLSAVSGGTAQIGINAADDVKIKIQEEKEIGGSNVQEDGMLVLARRVSEKILLGDTIEIMLVSIIGDTVRIGINAPRDIKIMRLEVLEEVRNQNLQAAKTQGLSEELKGLLPKKESNHGEKA